MFVEISINVLGNNFNVKIEYRYFAKWKGRIIWKS